MAQIYTSGLSCQITISSTYRSAVPDLCCIVNRRLVGGVLDPFARSATAGFEQTWCVDWLRTVKVSWPYHESGLDAPYVQNREGKLTKPRIQGL